MNRQNGIQISQKLIDSFLEHCSTHHKKETLSQYRTNIQNFFDALPAGKMVNRDTVKKWGQYLTEKGYSPQSVNVRISSINSFLIFLDHKELTCGHVKLNENVIQPELTRSEYIRLLQTAREKGQHRAYLLIKTLASMDISLDMLQRITYDDVCSGRLTEPEKVIYFPKCLQEELLAYADEQCISGSTPIFVTRSGTPIGRAYLHSIIRSVGAEAKIPEEKCNARCLRRLCQKTQGQIRRDLSVLCDRAYDRLLEDEQLVVGWTG